MITLLRALILAKDINVGRMARDVEQKLGKKFPHGKLSKIIGLFQPPTDEERAVISAYVGCEPEDLLKDAREFIEQIPGLMAARRASDSQLSEPFVSPSAYDAKAEAALHVIPPDYSAAEAAKLRVIRSITYDGPNAVTVTIAPLRLAASPPEQLDPNDEGTVTIDPDDAEVRNAPIFPVRVFGTSMNNVVDAGDLVFYRRSRSPRANAIVIAYSGGGITMKRLRGKKLYPDSTDEHETITPLDDDGLIGEVVAIHKPSKPQS